jgi:hypothetical protein
MVDGRRAREIRCFPSWASSHTKHREPKLAHQLPRVGSHPCFPEDRQANHGLDPTKLETGGVVGIAKIVDCVTTHRSRWFEGPYGFVLRRGLPFVRWTGALGLRDAPARAGDLRLSADPRCSQAAGAGCRSKTAQSQASLPGHEDSWPAARAPRWRGRAAS